MRLKKVLLVISLIGLFLLSNYMVFQYTIKLCNQQLNAKKGKTAVSSLLFLDQNRTQPIKFLLAIDIYYNIVGASLQKKGYVDDINYYYFLCEHWDDNLKDVVLKSLQRNGIDSSNPRDYELFLDGTKNLDQLCKKENND